MKKRKLKINSFYLHKDYKGGHPALIYGYEKESDEYKAVCFTSKEGHSRIRLKYSINPRTSDKSFIRKQPIKRRIYKFEYKKRLKGFRIRKADKPLVESIKRKK